MAQATQIDWDNADELTTEQLDELEMRSQGMAGANPGAIAATPFYQDRVEGRGEPPEEEALTDTQFDEMREQKYADPAYIMTREEFDEFYEDRIKDREFERFVDGAVEGVKALVPLAGQVAEDVASVGVGLLTEPLTTNARITQTLGEATRLVGVNLAQLYDWGSHKMSAVKRSSERAEMVDQSIRERLEQEGKLTGDREQDMQIFSAAKFEARKAGAYDVTEEQATEDRALAYDHYVRQKAFDQEAAKVKEVSYGGNEVQIESMTEDKYRLANAEPYEGLAMATSMVVDPINLIPVGAGYFAKLRLLRRMSHLEKPTALAGKGAANLAEKANRLENAISSRVQQITGLTPDQQVAGSALLAGAALYVDQTVGGGGYLHKGVATVVGAPAALRLGGGVLRRTGQGLDSASIVMREAGTGGIGATRAAAASDLRTNAAIPERYRKFYDGGFNYSADSTLRRVAANPELPGPMRGLARLADKAGATQAFRLTDDAVSGMAAGAAIGAPFAFLPDDPTRQGNIFGAITAFGALGGVASGAMGRSRAVVDADIARMFADVYAVGGNVERMAQLPHRTLDQMSAMQGMLSGKVDFVPLDGVEFHSQTKSNNAGLFLEKGTDGRGRVFINMDAVSEKGGITAHEIGHAILTSNVLDGQPRADLRNLVSQQYGTDGIQARGREYAAKVVDGELRARTTGDEPSILTEAEMKRMDEGATIQDIVAERAANDPEYRNKLIDDKMKELDDAYMSEGGQPLDWARDEIIAESFSADAPLMDFRSIRNREMAPYLAESALAAMSRVFETFGARFSDTGKLLDSPNRIFSENPLFRDPVVQRRIKEYVRTYDNFLEGMENNGAPGKPGVQIARTGRPEDLGRSPHVKLRDEGNGVLENDFMVQLPDGTFRLKSQQTVNAAEAARAAQIKTLYNAQKRVPPNSTEFGVRVVDGRETVGGPVLPKQFDLFTNFPKHVREAARGFEAGRERGESWFIDYNAIGTGASGRYRVTNLGNVRAIQREVVPFGWQVSKANHLLAVSLDLNAFRAAAMKAINRGELGVFNNEMAQVETAFKTYLDNHRNGRPGEAGIGMEARDVLNGLIGTGTAVQRKANPLYTALNPKGSIRTFRMDRLNEARTSGREGFTFDYDKTKFNRMPETLPEQAGPREAIVTPDGLAQVSNDTPTFTMPRRAMAQFMPDTGIRLDDYADRPIVALPADRMGIGQLRVGPKGNEQVLSVPGQGGAGFMEIYNGGGWAFTDTATADRFLGRLREVARPGENSVIVGITALNEVNHLKNQTGQLAYVEALEAAINSKAITKKQADAHIREIAKRIYTSDATPKSLTPSTRAKFKSMRGFDDFQKAVRAKQLNFADAAWLLDKMQQKTLPLPYKDAQAIGIAFDDVARQTADPRYADVPFGTVVALLEVPINQAPSRNPFHYAYPAKVEGNRIGFLSKFQNIDDLTSDPRIRNKQGRVTAQPLQTVLPVMDRIGARGQAMPDVADIASSTSVGALQKHPMFKAAKYDGSAKAAFDIVESMVKPKAVKEVMDKIDPNRPAYIIPVIAREGESANMLPLAMAEKLSAETGIPVWMKLAKTSSQHNTGAGADSRARTMHRWEGEPPPAGSQIVLVDDTYTTGQTLRSLASVVGDPDAVATISVGRYTKQFTLQPDREQKLLAKAGLTKQQFINLYGSEPKQVLTGAQAQQYLLNGARGQDGLLARFPADRGGFSTQAIAGLTQLPEGVTTFSGGGLVEIGLRGIVRPTVAVEYSPAIAQAYRAAHGDHVKVQDIRTVSLEDHKGKFHYHASPVCKNSSLLKSAALGGGEKDLDVQSAQAVARHIDEIEPKVVTIENVPDYAKTQAADIIRQKLKKNGYIIDEKVYNAAEFGAPTARRRYLLRAVKGGLLPEPVPQQGPGWYSTVVDMIDTLPDDSIARAQYIYRSLREQGVDPDNVTEPLLVSGTTLFKKVAFARPDQPAFTFKATPATVDRILLPGGRVKRVTARAKARMTGIPDDYPLPNDEKTALTIIGNGVPPALVRNVFGPVIEANK
jgi:site-specific DNA-cytosine methylase